MASNGLLRRAKKGKCKICQRVRDTDKYMKIVGQVSHGYATGYHWACRDSKECKDVAIKKLNDENVRPFTKEKIKIGLEYY